MNRSSDDGSRIESLAWALRAVMCRDHSERSDGSASCAVGTFRVVLHSGPWWARMRGRVVPALLVLLLALTSIGPSHAHTEWEHYLPFPQPGGLGMHFGDFDGDGVGELLVAGSGVDSTTDGSYRLAVLASTGGDAYAFRSIASHLGQVQSRTVAWTGQDGMTRVAALVRGYPHPSIVIHVGVPLRIERVLPAPLAVGIDLVADVDGDGSLEMVIRTSTATWSDQRVPVLALDSGEVKWVSSHSALTVAAGQFDDDPAMELVLAGTPGRILDGASGAVEWSYPSGFGTDVVVGRFGHDPSRDAIAALFFESVILFRSQPYSPVSETHTRRDRAVTAPRDDGGHLLVRGSNVYDLRTGELVAGDDTDLVSRDIAGMGVADFDSDGVLEVAYSDGFGSGEGHSLIVRSMLGRVVELLMSGESTYSTIASGNIAGAGGQEVVFLSRVTRRPEIAPYPYTVSRLRILDVETGALLRQLDIVFESDPGSLSVALGQLDADPALEIIVSGGYGQALKLVALDGATLQTQWAATQRPPGDSTLSSLSLIDIDGNGVPALVALTEEGRVVRYDARTGHLVWHTDPVPSLRYGGMKVYIDHAGSPMAIGYSYDTLSVFDLRSRQLVRSISLPCCGQIMGVDVDQRASGTCRIGVLRGAAAQILTCNALGLIDQWPVPSGALFLRWVREGSSMLVAAAGAIHLVQRGGPVHAFSGYIGGPLGQGNRAVLTESEETGEIDLMIGSGHMVTRMRLPRDGIFSGDFDATREGR